MNKLYSARLRYWFLLPLVTMCVCMYAQNATISGTVTDNSDPLYGATVVIAGTTNGTTTDFDGNYSISAEPGTYSVVVSYIGYADNEQLVSVGAGEKYTLNFTMSEGVAIDEIVVIGSRAAGRTNTDSPVPIDVIDVSKLALAAPQTSINQLLHNTTPSFSSNTQTISDGTDHIDPASLRGLGPDQVLVLVNQKRRHNTSLVNVNGTFGRGSVGTDMNAIPASAIQNIEVLRDGAAAQYGSDAIAGVINLRLKKSVNELNFNVTAGGNFTSGDNIGSFEGTKEGVDGEVFNVGVNYGLPIGEDGGFINFTGEYNQRQPTNRMLDFEGGIYSVYNGIERVAAENGADVSALTFEQVQQFASGVGYLSADQLAAISAGTDLASLSGVLGENVTDAELSARGQTSTDFNMRVGQSELRGGQFFANMGIPLGENWEIYGFGGIGYREGQSGCFYRLPNQNRTSTAIYPNGTVPRINSNITDQSIAAGIKGSIGDWNIDFSNTNGSNEFLYKMTQTHNATLGASSPTTFNVGGHKFIQNTTNFDVSQYFEQGESRGINVAFGAEYKYENYLVEPGVENSYGNFDINGNLVNSVTDDELLTADILGRGRPAGSQCFSGFLPSNFVDARRNSVAGYLDVEYDITEAFLIGAALRAENFSDFGSTFNYKLVSRYKINDNFVVRGAISTGFRAPSLHQLNYNKTSTIFTLINRVSVPQERGTFSNDSRAAQLLGIPQLKEETSQNLSFGFTAKVPAANLKFTLDAYQVNIDDRVILTGAFSAGDDPELQLIFDQSGAGAANFFSNAIDTRSRGIDVVISHRLNLGNDMVLKSDLAGTLSKTEWVQDITQDDLADDDPRIVSNGVKASALLEEKGLVGTYFNQESQLYLEQAVPRTKVTLSNTLNIGKLSVYLRNTYFGETTEATNDNLYERTDVDGGSNNGELVDGFTLRPDSELIDNFDHVVDPFNSAKILTDLSFGYQFLNNLSVTIGGQNIFDVYPDLVDSLYRSSGRFIYSRRSPQFSFGGRHLFARVVFTLK